MSWFQNLKLKPKLLSAFGLCALITLGVAGLGGSGISTLYGQLQDLVSNNLISIQKTDLVKANVIATNRDLYKAVALASVKADPKDIEAAIASFKDNQAEASSNFKIYRATPLEPDERAAGDAFENDWPAYVAQTEKVFQALQAGDLPRATDLLLTAVTPAYKTAVAEVKVMTESNARQAIEVSNNADQTNTSVMRALVIGSALAVLMGLALGLLITRAITRPLYQSVESANHVAKGDLTQAIPAGGQDEIGMLLRALGDMQGNLKTTVRQIADASDQLASAAEELTVVTDDSSRGLVRQNDEIQQAATAVNEMTAAVEEVARNAAGASQVSTQTAEDAVQGQRQVRQAVTAIDGMTQGINDSTKRIEALADQIRGISKVLDVIRGIAEQTNLLALNAAIEAARAGEQGRGFAVVADEVRALAHRTQSSTGEIESMINSVQSSADGVVQAMASSRSTAQSTQALAAEAGKALERISEGVGQINERNLVIATAAEEQAQVAREVDQNLVNIQDLSTQTAAGANQTNASSQELSRLAVSFGAMVGRFKL